MKKVFILIALVAFIANTSAQDRIAVGLKAGFNSTSINLSNIPTGDEVKNEAKSGFLFGAYGRLRLLGGLSFQPEIYYAKKNSQYSINNGTTVTGNGTFHTWDIPLLANLQIIDLKVARIYGVAGPVASLMSKTSFDDVIGLEKSDFKSTNWTLQAGAGVEFWRLTADFRYEWGLTDISDIANYDIGQKTDVFTFSVGFKLFGI
ncbi:porin family protein [Carboxylicivirga sp. N1Y90]|uniref:porin family protein n=1 Tax=Carboxylicivirga fragile TaxID=3417571 RepID=UPI003D33224A|nr:PorT family protein [Marinilabiliaceae bacterium N1Y90]